MEFIFSASGEITNIRNFLKSRKNVLKKTHMQSNNELILCISIFMCMQNLISQSSVCSLAAAPVDMFIVRVQLLYFA